MWWVLWSVVAAAEDAKGALARANEALYQHDVAAAREWLGTAADSGPTPEDRAQIEVQLATLAWRYFGDPAAADLHLEAAEATGARPSDPPAERSRMFTALGRFDEAQEAALTSLAAARTATETTRATVAYADAVLADPNEADVARALALVQAVVTREPGLLAPSRQLVGLALLAGDGPAALVGWQSYAHVTPDRPPSGILAGPAAELAESLPGWSPADPVASERVAVALAGSKMFPEAAVAAPEVPSPAVREIVAYARFVADVRRSTDGFYRETALGRGRPRAHRREVERAARVLWADLVAPAPPFTRDYAQELDRRFGAVVNFGRTSGYRDLHMGHRVVDERRAIAQYGHTAEVRFVSLDAMVSNGFQSWAWDGRAQHGGWADATTIVQVRSAYVDGPLAAWRRLHDPDEIALREERLAEVAERVDQPYGYVPVLRARLQLQGEEGLLARLRSEGLDGDALRLAFLAAYEQAVVESSIYAHEGRHAIDRGMDAGFDPAEMEFRAKLSEVAFAPEPRLAISGIFDANIGDPTSHGTANERIMDGLSRWMDGHAREIDGLDASRPLLPQFDRLTDDQIRAAFRSLDPFAAADTARR